MKLSKIYIKKLNLLLFVFTAYIACASAKETEVISIETNQTSLIFTVNNSNQLIFRYYGEKIEHPEFFSFLKNYNKADTDRDLGYEAYPAYGLGFSNEPALSLTHFDGALITELEFTDKKVLNVDDNVTQYIIFLKDRVYDLSVELHINTFKKEDIYSNNILELTLHYKDEDSNCTLDNSYIKQIRMKYWKALFMSDQFMGLFTSNLREEYLNKINELRNYDFSGRLTGSQEVTSSIPTSSTIDFKELS